MTTPPYASGPHPEPGFPPPGTTPPPAPGRPLLRRSDDKVVAGVAGGIGYWLNIDPVLIRVLFIVLTFTGGLGLLLYVICWASMPRPDSARAGQAPWASGQPWQQPWPFLALVVVAVAIACADSSATLAAVAVIAAVAFVAVRPGQFGYRPTGTPAGPAAGPQPAAGPTVGPATAFTDTRPYGVTQPPYAGSAPYQPAAAPTPPARPRSRSITRPVAGIALVAAGVAALLNAAGVGHLGVTGTLAFPLAGIGIGLIALSRLGRSWLMTFVGVVLALTMLGNAGAHRVHVSNHRVWRPASAADLSDRYSLGAGNALLDLSALKGGDAAASALAGDRIHVWLGAGHLEVRVPHGVPVQVDASTAIGTVRVFGDDLRGNGRRHLHTDPGFASDTGLRLEVRVGTGDLEVTRD